MISSDLNSTKIRHQSYTKLLVTCTLAYFRLGPLRGSTDTVNSNLKGLSTSNLLIYFDSLGICDENVILWLLY